MAYVKLSITAQCMVSLVNIFANREKIAQSSIPQLTFDKSNNNFSATSNVLDADISGLNLVAV